MSFTKEDLEWLDKHKAKRAFPGLDCDIFRLSFPNCRIDVSRGEDGEYEATVADLTERKLASDTCDCLRGAIASCSFSLENETRRLQGIVSEIGEVLK